MAKTIEEILARAVTENRKREAKTKPKKGEALAAEAAFLKRWAKGKPIVRQSADATFWAAGKWMTQLPFPTVDAIVAAGFGEVTGKTTEAGCRLVMK